MCYAIHWGRLTCLLTNVETCSFGEIYIAFLNETFIWERWWNCNHYHEKALRYVTITDNIFEDQNPIIFGRLCSIMIYPTITLFHIATYDTFYLFISSSFHFTSLEGKNNRTNFFVSFATMAKERNKGKPECVCVMVSLRSSSWRRQFWEQTFF